ncbi:phosphomevalonate kinase [Powellomyces hirtus]|uniref:Phosphomevalonate kinase n=1 Tax=Powellomyces hirtus TaxID=109895 RepID=A0A507E2W2_9FUNG|nr:phosphomevalonate kinase [Powellomyces hirtus]
MAKATIVSAPGKVLLTGGYLVLDRSYKGLVVAADSRFYTIVRSISDVVSVSDKPVVRVKSPQFLNGLWEYEVFASDVAQITLRPVESSQAKNPYVESALVNALEVAMSIVPTFHAKLGNGLEIQIVGANDFYSQREQLAHQSLPLTTESLKSLPAFCPTLTNISSVHKTGLGSSAAMITSLVGAVVSHFDAVQLPKRSERPTEGAASDGMRLVHNTAQVAHCLAQGKVGSGFDVSAAVYGSHSYRRFSASVIDGYIEKQKTPASVPSNGILSVIDQPSNTWDNEIEQFALPPRFNMLLADIDAGSSTPKLVSQVLAWRKANAEEAQVLWSKLGAENSALEMHMRELASVAASDINAYNTVVDALAKENAALWSSSLPATNDGKKRRGSPIRDLFMSIHQSFQRIRGHLREMSDLTNVPIEPEEQTRLLDACLEVPGIIMAGVPGAGGFDAIFCIALSDAAREQVEGVWKSWTEMAVAPLLSRESNAGISRIESESDVPGLSDALHSISEQPTQ